jgi:hypothetical protein
MKKIIVQQRDLYILGVCIKVVPAWVYEIEGLIVLQSAVIARGALASDVRLRLHLVVSKAVHNIPCWPD